MTTLQAQSRTISRYGDQIVISLQPHNYGIDVRATLYKGGIDGANPKDMTILSDHTYRDTQAHDAQNHYDQAVMILADA